MQSVKEQVKEMLDVLPEDITYDDIHYHLFVREKIDKGTKDIAEGRIVTEEEMEARFKKWLER
jgi:predicted transcriptional regulator